jgi:hypothetical protein
VLYEEGVTFAGALGRVGIVAALNKVGPFAGSNVTTYKMTGLLAYGSQDFSSFEDAVKAVDESATRDGVRIEG